jgi:hypothetical protein
MAAEPGLYWRVTANDVTTVSPATQSATTDVPTCLIVNGSTTTLGEGEGGAIVETPTVVELFQPYALKGASFSQKVFEGELTPIPGGGDKPTVLQLVRRITTKTTRENGCVQRIQVDTEENFRPEAARFSQSGPSGSILARAGVFLDADATQNGTETAYVEAVERLRLISRVVTTPNYTGPEGELENTTIRTGRFFNPRAALFTVNPVTETQTPLSVFLRGNGGGVQLSEEKFFGGPDDLLPDGPDQIDVVFPLIVVWFQVQTLEIDHDTGYEVGRATENIGFDITGSGVFSYDDEANTRSEHDAERALVLTREEIVRTAIAGEESTHGAITTNLDKGSVTDIISEQLLSYLPAAQACSLDSALRNSNKPFGAIVCAGERHRHARIEVLDNPWVENIAEARAFGIQRLRELTAIEVAADVPPNATLRQNQRVDLHLPERGWTDEPCWIHTIAHRQAERSPRGAPQPILGRVVLRVPVV